MSYFDSPKVSVQHRSVPFPDEQTEAVREILVTLRSPLALLYCGPDMEPGTVADVTWCFKDRIYFVFLCGPWPTMNGKRRGPTSSYTTG